MKFLCETNEQETQIIEKCKLNSIFFQLTMKFLICGKADTTLITNVYEHLWLNVCTYLLTLLNIIMKKLSI